MPVGTPQLRPPACLTLSTVGPAFAGCGEPSPRTRPSASSAVTHLPVIQSPLVIAAPTVSALSLIVAPTLAQPGPRQQRGPSIQGLVASSGPTRYPAARISAMWCSTERLSSAAAGAGRGNPPGI